jgi:hypothetical protein
MSYKIHTLCLTHRRIREKSREMNLIAPLMANNELLLTLIVVVVLFVVGYIGFVIYVVVTVNKKQAAGDYNISHEEFWDQQKSFYDKKS